MPLLLPNLDDRNWAELVDEGRALIPVYGPEWTDHNASDPGITLIELLAWVAEMDIYELNQISDRERLKFLKLLGVVPRPPLPARAALRITLANGSLPLSMPAGVEFAAPLASAAPPRFRTLDAVTLAPGTLEALQFRDATGFHDLTPAWRRGTLMNPLGLDPHPGVELYMGLSTALPQHAVIPFYFTFADGHSGFSERERILREVRVREKDCVPPANPCDKRVPSKEVPEEQSPQGPLQHHGVRTIWEFMTSGGGGLQWLPLDPSKKEIEDNTRAFTLDGSVVLRLPSAVASTQVGAVPRELYYLRCRVVAGSYDAAPALQDVAFNGVRVEQYVASGMSFIIDPAAHITFTSQPPKPNEVTPLTMALDAKRRIVELTLGGDSTKNPSFRVYDFRAPAGGAAGLLAIEGVFLGFGTGFPNQQLIAPDAPVQQSSFQLFTSENNGWRRWKPVRDFDASTRKDFHFMLDPSTGTVTFGTGEKGQVPPGPQMNGTAPREQCMIFATYGTTLAAAGNVPASAISQLADSPHNRAALYDPAAVPDGWTKFNAQLKTISNRLPAIGGAAEETVAHASGRADRLVESSDRAITLADYERLAMQTPGTRIARVSARANLHPSFPCFKAPGMITVIVLPFLPQRRPTPSPGLLQAVRAYLRRRRIVGTRVELTGPTYLDLSVEAEVRALGLTNKAKLQEAVISALNKFLDPLQGGPDGSGWPFGRDVYRSEIMRVIDEVPGVDCVLSLALIAGSGQPQCGNVCLGPTWLVAAGPHQITVS